MRAVYEAIYVGTWVYIEVERESFREREMRKVFVGGEENGRLSFKEEENKGGHVTCGTYFIF